MTEELKPCQATPEAELREYLMDPRIAKSELEWFASREIKRLEELLSTRSPAWRDDMDAAKEYQNSRHSRGDDRLGVIVVCQWGTRWSANHAWWNDHEEEWNDISGDQIVHPAYWAPLPPKLKAGGEHDNDK